MSYAEVTLLPAGQVIVVESGESILDAALRAGLNLPHSCKGGHCSSCRARLLDGRIRYPQGEPPGLSANEMAGGHILLCQARADSPQLAVEVRRIEPPVAEPQIRSVPCRIERMEPRAPDVMAVFLRLPQREPFTFVAGQYIDIMLPGSRRRSFSLANPPHDAALLELHIRRVRGGEFTQQLFESMHEKTLLRIEGPLGQFWFREESPRPALLVGGGTGYAPLRAMLRHLLENGDRRPLRLYWGARSRIDLYEEAQVREWTTRHPNLKFIPVLSDPLPADGWAGGTGPVHAAVLQEHPDLSGHDVYAAGPPAMVEAVKHEFTAAGLPPDQLFFDSFDYAPDALAKLRSAGLA